MTALGSEASGGEVGEVHHKIGLLTRQLHTALTELGYADQLRGTMGELPDAQSRLSYISRLTGEAAEKVLTHVELAKAQNDYIAAETNRVMSALVADPVATVAKGEVYNFLTNVQRVSKEADTHLIEIMMAQDFHDLTGQVIARVVTLAATIEQQMLQMLVQTAPLMSPAPTVAVTPTAAATATPAPREALQGPVVNPEKAPDVVTSQEQVDDLLASLGF